MNITLQFSSFLMFRDSFGIDETFMINAQNKCYIVATCDRDLKRRIRKVRSFAPA